MKLRPALWGVLAALALWVGSAQTIWADEPSPTTPSPTVPGIALQELLILAKHQSPGLVAARLDAEAALARQDAAGVLPDPLVRVEGENMPDGMAISSNLKTTVEQELPLWGKLSLQRKAAGYQTEAAQSRQRQAELELRRKIKVLYATRYTALAGLNLTQELKETAQKLAAIGKARYGQALGSQDEAIKPEVAAVELEADLLRLQTQADNAGMRLNALLGRAFDAPLATSTTVPPLPSSTDLSLTALLDKALKTNPALAESKAQVAMADTNHLLAGRNRYPDLNLGLSHTMYERNKPSDGVMAEMRIPLHWGVKEDEIRASGAEAEAAQNRHTDLAVQMQSEIAATLAEYQTVTKTIDLFTNHHLPELELALQSKQAAMANAKADLNAVLESAQEVRRMKLEILKMQVEQQSLLADLERLTGGEL